MKRSKKQLGWMARRGRIVDSNEATRTRPDPIPKRRDNPNRPPAGAKPENVRAGSGSDPGPITLEDIAIAVDIEG